MSLLKVGLGLTGVLLALASAGDVSAHEEAVASVEDRVTVAFPLGVEGRPDASSFSFSVRQSGTMVGVLSCGQGRPLVSLLLTGPREGSQRARVHSISDGPIVFVEHVSVDEIRTSGQWRVTFASRDQAECMFSLDHGGIVEEFGADQDERLTDQRDALRASRGL
jgi:hypothetical protein